MPLLWPDEQSFSSVCICLYTRLWMFCPCAGRLYYIERFNANQSGLSFLTMCACYFLFWIGKNKYNYVDGTSLSSGSSKIFVEDQYLNEILGQAWSIVLIGWIARFSLPKWISPFIFIFTDTQIQIFKWKGHRRLWKQRCLTKEVTLLQKDDKINW